MISTRTTPCLVSRKVSVPSIARPRVTVRSTPKEVDVKLQQALKEAQACDDKKDVS